MSTIKTLKKLAIYTSYRALRCALEFISFLISLLISPRRAAIPPIDDQNLVTPAIKLSQQIRSGHISAEEVVESFINRIKLVNPLINAVVDRRFEQALKEARDIDRKIADALNGEGDKTILNKPLLGVPISIKETIAVEGFAHTGGLKGRKFIKAQKHAEAIQLIIENGLIPIALTNIPELAMWWDSNNPIYGRTNNPYDLSRIPGGSSGGEAALLASAGSVIGVGSDIAGSIRMPANFCGLFGHKTTPFVVSNAGMFPPCQGEREKLLSMGPMTRYACDLVPLLKIMAGPRASKLKLDEPVDLSKIKILYIEDLGDPLAATCNPDILAGMRNSIAHLVQKFKIQAEKVIIDEFKYGLYIWSAEANLDADSPRLAESYKGGQGGELNPPVEIFKKMFKVSDHTLSAIIATLLEKFSPNHGTRAQKVLSKKAAELRKKFSEMMGENGILLMPTHPEPAPKHHTTMLKVFNVSYTSVPTVLRAPITQCPLGLSKEGLPYGMQIISQPYNDRLTIAVAEELEKVTGGWLAPCRIST